MTKNAHFWAKNCRTADLKLTTTLNCQNKMEILLNTKGQFMKESNTLVGYAIIKQLTSLILLNTKGQYMKESNTLAGYVTIKQQQREVLLNIKG